MIRSESGRRIFSIIDAGRDSLCTHTCEFFFELQNDSKQFWWLRGVGWVSYWNNIPMFHRIVLIVTICVLPSFVEIVCQLIYSHFSPPKSIIFNGYSFILNLLKRYWTIILKERWRKVLIDQVKWTYSSKGRWFMPYRRCAFLECYTSIKKKNPFL